MGELKDPNVNVMRRKQVRIYSRIEGMEAEFATLGEEAGQNLSVFPQPQVQEEENSTAHTAPRPTTREAGSFPIDADSSTDEKVQAFRASISAALTRENVARRPEPAVVGRAAVISSQTLSESGILASFESSFVLVSPGTFLMGSPDYETGRGGDEMIHEVTLTKAFFMQNTPVTQGLWNAVMENNPASFTDGGDDLPIESVSWNECQEFLRKLNSIMEGKYRLPTEAEWEYACRAESSTPFCNGEISELYCAHDPLLSEVGWYCGNSGRKSRPVARKSPNAWGLYDMHGNVSEWCLDWYGDYSTDPQEDPSGPKSGPGKVVRGGSWFSNAKNCRSAARFHWPPNSRSDFIGFRLVREIS